MPRAGRLLLAPPPRSASGARSSSTPAVEHHTRAEHVAQIERFAGPVLATREIAERLGLAR
jgi:hypothetical protein